MERITNQRLENRVALLNRILKRPEQPWSRKTGTLKANIGNLHISGAYGGVALNEMMNTSGGVHDISGFGHQSKRELDTFISGMLAGAGAKKGHAKNPSRKKRVKKNPSRYGSRLFVVFKHIGGKVYFFNGVVDKHGDTLWTSSKGSAALFKTKALANKIAIERMKRSPQSAKIGITHESTTVAEIKKYCGEKV